MKIFELLSHITAGRSEADVSATELTEHLASKQSSERKKEKVRALFVGQTIADVRRILERFLRIRDRMRTQTQQDTVVLSPKDTFPPQLMEFLEEE